MKTSTFILLVAVVGGTVQNRHKISHWFNPPPAIPHVYGTNQVIMYSTTWCPACNKTREYFAENHIEYTDLDVEHSDEAHGDYESLGGNGVPIVVINNGTPIHGFNPGKISEALANLENL